MSEKLSNEDNKYLISLIKEEKIVEAVKFVREKTDMSLLEAKKYVDLKRINENAEYSQSDNNISEDEKEYIVSLIQENKKLQAVAFLHKSKNMSLLEAKNYIDNLAPYIEKDMTKINSNSNNISNYKAKEIPTRRGHIFDEKLNIFIPNLARQRKFNKVILYILLLLTVISLIQLPFLDRTSYNQMLFFLFCSVSLLPLLVIWIGVALNIYFTEKTLKELEEVELTNEFEIKSLKENFTFFLFLFVLIFLILVKIRRNPVPIIPLANAIILDGKGICFTNIPMVPNIVIATISLILAFASSVFPCLFILQFLPVLYI